MRMTDIGVQHDTYAACTLDFAFYTNVLLCFLKS